MWCLVSAAALLRLSAVRPQSRTAASRLPDAICGVAGELVSADMITTLTGGVSHREQSRARDRATPYTWQAPPTCSGASTRHPRSQRAP